MSSLLTSSQAELRSCPFIYFTLSNGSCLAVLCQLELSAKEQEQKKRLIENAFGDWNKKDFRAFVAATERHGRCVERGGNRRRAAG